MEGRNKKKKKFKKGIKVSIEFPFKLEKVKLLGKCKSKG